MKWNARESVTLAHVEALRTQLRSDSPALDLASVETLLDDWLDSPQSFQSPGVQAAATMLLNELGKAKAMNAGVSGPRATSQ